MKLYCHYFTVTGTGRFPLDMLRYDQCYPLTPGDASAIADRGQRAIRLCTVQNVASGPTYRRWESFGWTINPESVEREAVS